MMKKIPVVHCSASDFSTDGVFSVHGPSSKVSTTSWSRRKSWVLKCSKPKPGPPVVSISTTRVTPSALGLLHAIGAGLGMVPGAAACATTVGAAGEAATFELAGWLGTSAITVRAVGFGVAALVGAAAVVAGRWLLADGQIIPVIAYFCACTPPKTARHPATTSPPII